MRGFVDNRIQSTVLSTRQSDHSQAPFDTGPPPFSVLAQHLQGKRLRKDSKPRVFEINKLFARWSTKGTFP